MARRTTIQDRPSKIRYLEVKAEVLRRIRDKTWPPDTIIPGEIELASEFGCARVTVNRAMRELAQDGYLDRKRKAGTRIKSSPTRLAKFTIPLIRHEIENSGANYRYLLIERVQCTAPKWLAARLNLDDAAQVIHLKCLHYADKKPLQFEDRWISLAAVPGAKHANFINFGPNEWLVNEVPFTDVEITFSATQTNTEVALHLDTAVGAAVFAIERATWLDGVPVTLANLSFGAGYKMTTRL